LENSVRKNCPSDKSVEFFSRVKAAPFNLMLPTRLKAFGRDRGVIATQLYAFPIFVPILPAESLHVPATTRRTGTPWRFVGNFHHPWPCERACGSIIMGVVARQTHQLLRMRGRSYVAFVFCPVVPIAGWLEEVDATIGRSPDFFIGKPVVLDLSAVDLSEAAIAHLVTSLEQRNIRVLGIEGVDADRLSSNLPPLLTGGRHCALTNNQPTKPEIKPKPASLLLESSVRSGQSFYTEGDVTILGSVGSGAEIVAGGSIHIYGTLRGRAMAGANGNSAARIYCQKIEAELVAVNGYYRTAEEIDAVNCDRPAQVWLDGSIMKITPLN
jgi:septum site-determining protein MinC